jgi:hypothetical protein
MTVFFYTYTYIVSCVPLLFLSVFFPPCLFFCLCSFLCCFVFQSLFGFAVSHLPPPCYFTFTFFISENSPLSLLYASLYSYYSTCLTTGKSVKALLRTRYVSLVHRLVLFIFDFSSLGTCLTHHLPSPLCILCLTTTPQYINQRDTEALKGILKKLETQGDPVSVLYLWTSVLVVSIAKGCLPIFL